MAPRTVRRFHLGRRTLEATAGDSLLDALAGRGLPNVVRSVRYHRPRAPFCGTGDCTGCLVRVNGRPNVRACRHPVAEGDRVEEGNAWPSARFDALGAVDLLFPHGLDTLHGFRRPAWARGLYHRVIRRLAGYAEPPDAAAAAALSASPRRIDTEIVIVGGGAAGTAAAARLVERGLRPLRLDRRRDLSDLPGSETLSRTTATFLPPPGPDPDRPFTLFGFEEPGRGVVVRCRSVVLAPGSYDTQLMFAGNDRPGVVSAELATQFARPGRRSPLHRAVVVGGGSRCGEVLEQLGDAVRAVVAPGDIGPDVARKASDLGVPLYPRTLVLAALGRSRVRQLELKGRGSGPRFSLPCDSVVLAHRRAPVGQLAIQSGAALEWRPDPGAYFPRTNVGGATTVPGLFVAGSAGGASRDGSRGSGERAADSLAAGAPPFGGAPEAPPVAPGEFEGYYRELLHERRAGKTVVCACEDVLLEEVERAVAGGYRGIEVIKRYTGLGTGLCQGRYCLPDALLLLSILERRPPCDVGSITQRPPAVPTPLAALAALAGEFPGEAVP
ncbi:MAG: 2Fe-2S iron-sulfur cluster-binding protein [Thermoplasmata archaeon]